MNDAKYIGLDVLGEESQSYIIVDGEKNSIEFACPRDACIQGGSFVQWPHFTAPGTLMLRPRNDCRRPNILDPR